MSRDRHDAWQVDLLDQDDQVKDIDILDWHDGSLRWDAAQAVQGGQITLTLSEAAVDLIDWGSDRVRITYLDGATTIPHGVWLLTIHRLQRKGPVVHVPLTLSDKTELLNKPVGEWLTYPTGTVVTTAMSSIVANHAGERLLIPASTETLAKAMTHPPDARWLDVINALAESIKYRPLYASATGVLSSKPIVPVNRRPRVGVYGAGDDETPIKPEWDDANNHWAIPTGVRVYVSRPNGARGWIGAADLPPEHPLSAMSRGKGDPRGHERLHIVSGTYTSAAKTQEAADHLLVEQVRPTRTIQLTHPVNGHALGDVAVLAHHDTDAEIIAREVRMGVGAVATTTLQAIYPEGGVPTWEMI